MRILWGVRNGHLCNTPAVSRQVRCLLSVCLLAVNSKRIFCQETEICLWIYTEDRPEMTEQQPGRLLSLGKCAQGHGLTLQLQLVYCLHVQLSPLHLWLGSACLPASHGSPVILLELLGLRSKVKRRLVLTTSSRAEGSCELRIPLTVASNYFCL